MAKSVEEQLENWAKARRRGDRPHIFRGDRPRVLQSLRAALLGEISWFFVGFYNINVVFRK